MNALLRAMLRTLVLLIFIPLLIFSSTAAAQNQECSEKLLRDLGVVITNCDGTPAACGNSTAGGGSASGKKIYVIGDSLTVGMKNGGGLEAKLKAAGWTPVSIVAEGGKNLSWGLEQLNKDRAALASYKTDAVLIGLGTNEVGTVVRNGSDVVSGGKEAIKARVNEYVNFIRQDNPNARIYWTSVYITGMLKTDSGEYNMDVAMPIINAALSEIEAEQKITVLPWGASNEAREYVDDGIHPTTHYQEMATYIVGLLGNPPVTSPGSATPVPSGQTSNNAGSVVVLDPGHVVSISDRVIDSETGIDVTEDPREFETKNVWDVALSAKGTLEGLGYRVILTRDTYEDSSINLRSRAEVANELNANLAISIHTTGTDPGNPNAGNEVFYQKAGRGLFRTLLSKPYLNITPPRPTNYDFTFNDSALEAKSKAAAETMVTKYQESGLGTARVSDTANSRRGSIWTVQYFAKVPWIYAEVGSTDGTNVNNLPQDRKDKYAATIVETVKALVPITGAPSTPNPASSNSCIKKAAPTILPGSDNAEKVWNYFVTTQSLPVHVAAGFLGNMQEESHFEPRIVEYGWLNSRGEESVPGSPSSLDDVIPPNQNEKGQPGYGLIQWTAPSRKQGLRDFAAATNRAESDLTMQLDYVMNEIKAINLNKEVSIDLYGKVTVYEALLATTSVEQASELITRNYEIPGDMEGAVTRRISNSIGYLNTYGGSVTP